MATKKPKAPAPSSQKADKKRADILKAAGRCFRRTGFHLASMQEICTETNLGPGAVYRYFPSKDAIIEAMADDERTQARAILRDMQEADDLDTALATMTAALAVRYKNVSEAGMMTEVYAEGMRNKRVGKIVKKSEDDWIAGLTELLLTAQQRGQIDADMNTRHTALLLTALCDGMVIRQAYHLEDKSEALSTFFDAMLRKLLFRADIKEIRLEKRSKPVPVPAPPQAATAETVLENDCRQLSLI